MHQLEPSDHKPQELTPFSAMKKLRKREPPCIKNEPPPSKIIDSDLQKQFQKRQVKNADPNSLMETEKTVYERMKNTRANTRQTEDDSELQMKFKERKEIFSCGEIEKTVLESMKNTRANTRQNEGDSELQMKLNKQKAKILHHSGT